MSTQPSEFVITRTFNAPRDRVFKAWTDLDALKAWFGPKGMPVTFGTLDLRPGGAFHYKIESANGQFMWGKWIYREVQPPNRVVWVASFSDDSGAITRAPFSNDWPLEVLTTLTLEETSGQTQLTLVGVPLNGTDAELNIWRSMFSSMNGGWGATLDQLDVFLAK